MNYKNKIYTKLIINTVQMAKEKSTEEDQKTLCTFPVKQKYDRVNPSDPLLK